MSVDIEFDRVAFVKRTEGLTMTTNDVKYLLCVQHGSNNFLNSYGDIIKDWIVFKFGTKEEIIKQLDVLKTSIKGGSFKVNGSRINNIKQYKNMVREVLNEAEPFRKFNVHFPCAEHLIEVNHDREKSTRTIEQLRSVLGEKWQENTKKDTFLGDEEILTKFTKPIEHMSEIEEYYEQKREGIEGVYGKYNNCICLSR